MDAASKVLRPAVVDARRPVPVADRHQHRQHDPQRGAAVDRARTSAPRARELQWIIDAYTIVFACLLLTAGSLGDRLGRKGALTVGLVVFGTFSALASQATLADHADRRPGLMGIGGAFIFPTHAVDPHQHVPRRRGAGPGHRHLGRRVRPRRRHRPARRRPAARALLVGLGVPRQRARSASPPSCSATSSCPTRRIPRRARSTRSARCSRSSAWWACSSASSRCPTAAGATRGSSPGSSSASSSSAVFLLWERYDAYPMLDLRFFQNPRFSAASATITLTFFAPVRLDVPADPVLPVRARLLAAEGGDDDRAGRHRHHGRRAPGAEVRRALRHQAGGRRRACCVVAGCLSPATAATRSCRRSWPAASSGCCSASAWVSPPRRPPSRSWARCRRARPASAPRSTTPPARPAARSAWP